MATARCPRSELTHPSFTTPHHHLTLASSLRTSIRAEPSSSKYPPGATPTVIVAPMLRKQSRSSS
eukprot:4074894-Pyramimonas_sp.AAC.1